MTPLDLVLYTGAVYGLAWLVVRSTLAAPLRRVASRWTFTWALTRCVVCTGAWAAVALAICVPYVRVFSLGFRAALTRQGWLDLGRGVTVLVLVAWSLMACWALGRALGDAD